MPTLDIIKLLWDAGKEAYQIALGVKKKKDANRMKVAEIFDHIGQLLLYVALQNKVDFGFNEM